jgi:hypothetical protein
VICHDKTKFAKCAGYYFSGTSALENQQNWNYAYADGMRLARIDDPSSPVTEYVWDHRNQLTQVDFKTSDGAIGKHVEYNYDAFGRQIQKVVISHPSSNVTQTVKTNYVFSGQKPVAELTETVQLDGQTEDETTTNSQAINIYGPVPGGIIARVDRKWDGDDLEEETILYLPDANGTVRDFVEIRKTIRTFIFRTTATAFHSLILVRGMP